MPRSFYLAGNLDRLIQERICPRLRREVQMRSARLLKYQPRYRCENEIAVPEYGCHRLVDNNMTQITGVG